MHIDITDENEFVTKEVKQLLRKILQFVGREENIHPNSELSLVIVSDEAIKQLNNDYRGKDEVTDVLSFPLYEADEIAANTGSQAMALGDIVIAHDRSLEQAKMYNHSFEREIAFLAVHGLLHLLGYTHETSAEEKEMFARQEAALKEFQLERE
ncbi:MAG TPA: rRNA maturation RNase YbeY [Pseudogracilibacillus sp.]|nr:rRNA maturation RNase YbeY [Pseudogracilibacillus sp.]